LFFGGEERASCTGERKGANNHSGEREGRPGGDRSFHIRAKREGRIFSEGGKEEGLTEKRRLPCSEVKAHYFAVSWRGRKFDGGEKGGIFHEKGESPKEGVPRPLSKEMRGGGVAIVLMGRGRSPWFERREKNDKESRSQLNRFETGDVVQEKKRTSSRDRRRAHHRASLRLPECD